MTLCCDNFTSEWLFCTNDVIQYTRPMTISFILFYVPVGIMTVGEALTNGCSLTLICFSQIIWYLDSSTAVLCTGLTGGFHMLSGIMTSRISPTWNEEDTTLSNYLVLSNIFTMIFVSLTGWCWILCCWNQGKTGPQK